MKRFLLIFIFSLSLLGVLFVSRFIFAVNETKTIKFFVGQEVGAVTSPLSWPINFYIGDNITATSTRSAFFEVDGIAQAGAPVLTFSLGGGLGTCQIARTINTTGANSPFHIIYDVTSCLNLTGGGNYSRTLNVSIAGGSISNLSSSLNITYDFLRPDRNALLEVKTVKYAPLEGTLNTSPLNFDIYVGDNIKVLKSAFFEVNGVTQAGVPTITLSLGGGAGTCQLIRTINSAGASNAFKIIYDATNCMNIASRGIYTRSLNFSATPALISLVSANLTLTYEYQPPVLKTGKLLYRTSGSIFSSTFDTAINGGAAINSIIWKGTNPGNGARVKFQIATSNCPNGAIDPPTCGTGTWNYLGPDGSIATYYEPIAPNTPVNVSLAFTNNERYFRYKITLIPTIDQLDTPIVTDVILGWSR